MLKICRIIDPLMVYDNINLGRRIDPVWPEAEWRAKGGRNSWNNWIPMEEMKGVVLHRWTPLHPHPMHRSHTDKTILLLKIEDKYVPIAEHAVEIMYQDTSELRRSPKINPPNLAAETPAAAARTPAKEPLQQSEQTPAGKYSPGKDNAAIQEKQPLVPPTEDKTIIEETEKERIEEEDNIEKLARTGAPTSWTTTSTKLPTPPPLPPIMSGIEPLGQLKLLPLHPLAASLYSTSLSDDQNDGIPYMEADLPATPPTPLSPPAPATPPASPSSSRLQTPPGSPVSIRVPTPPLESPMDDSLSTLSPSGEYSARSDIQDSKDDTKRPEGDAPASSDPLTTITQHK